MSPKQHQTLAITAQYNLMSLIQQALNKRDTTGGMSQTPIERCNENKHIV